MDLSAIDREVRALERSLDSFEFWITVSTLLVVVGLIVEYWSPLRELIESIKKSPPFPWKKLLEMTGGVLVTIGVAGELWFQSRASVQQAILRSDSHQIEGLLSVTAGNAQKEAGSANERAGKANERAGKLEVEAATLRKQAASLMVDVASANAMAAEARSMAEAERLERVKLEERFSPRRLTQDQRSRIRDSVREFSGQQFSLAVYPDPEAIGLRDVVEPILTSAGWIRISSQIGDVEIGGAGIMYAAGVFVDCAPADIEALRGTIRALAAALSAEGIKATPRMNPQLTGKTARSVNLAIGMKPLPE